MQDGEHHMRREEVLATCLLDAVASAANMRSVPSETSTHIQSRVRVSAPCLTLTGTFGATVCSRCGSYASTFLPPVPRRSFAFCASRGFRRFGTMKALTPVRLTYRAGLPAYLATFLSFRLQPRGLPEHRYHHASVLSEFRT